MNFLLALVIGAICAVVGCFAAGFVASVCVDWYRIPSMEGAAGYYVVFIALGGGIAGFVIGLVAALVSFGQGRGFGIGLAIPAGIVLGIAVIALGLSWLAADIPPKLHGEELFVQTELMCPPGWSATNKIRAGGNHVTLWSIGADGSYRSSRTSALEIAEGREENGRTVLPGSVFLFTSTGKRQLHFTLGEQQVASFSLSLPGHPKEDFEQWSQWMVPTEAPSPEAAFQYRFRIARESAVKAEAEAKARQAAEERERRVQELTPESPIEEWLAVWNRNAGYVDPSGTGIDAAIKRMLAGRAEELVALASIDDDATATRAMEALGTLSPLPNPVEDKLSEALIPIRNRLQHACEVYNADDPDTVASGLLQARFTAWINAWGQFRIQRVLPAPKELAPIAALEEKCPQYTTLRSIAETAKFHMEVWAPEPESKPAAVPAPRI